MLARILAAAELLERIHSSGVVLAIIHSLSSYKKKLLLHMLQLIASVRLSGVSIDTCTSTTTTTTTTTTTEPEQQQQQQTADTDCEEMTTQQRKKRLHSLRPLLSHRWLHWLLMEMKPHVPQRALCLLPCRPLVGQCVVRMRYSR
jgi:hypothetical protein